MVAGAKGGSGKSITSAMLGLALAKRGLKVLAIELNTGARSLDIPCGVHGKIVYDLADIFEGRCDVQKAITQNPAYNNFHVICSQRGAGSIKPQMLGELIGLLQSLYSVIIIDVESGFGVPFKSACAVSNGALIVSETDIVSLNANQALANILCDYSHISTKLFINNVPDNLQITGINSLDECIDTIGVQLIGVMPKSDRIIKAACLGKPLDENCIEASIFKAIAARICGIHVPLIYK